MFVTGDLGKIGLDLHDEFQLFRIEERRCGCRSTFNDIGDRHTAHVPGKLAGFDLGEIEHVIDELGKPLTFADHDSEVFDHLRLGLNDLAVVFRNKGEEAFFKTAANDLGETQHRGEGSPQFMAHG